MQVHRTGQDMAASILLALVGLSLLGFWAAWLAQGNLADGINTVENNNYIAFHITAETVAGLVALAGAVGISMRRSWGRPVAFIAGGMVVYSTINSLGESVKNIPALTPVLIVSLVAVLTCFALLWSRRGMKKGPRQPAPVHQSIRNRKDRRHGFC